LKIPNAYSEAVNRRTNQNKKEKRANYNLENTTKYILNSGIPTICIVSYTYLQFIKTYFLKFVVAGQLL
jgi:hypothetical protein